MLSLVLPTFNEAANLTSLIDVIDAVLQGTDHEIIIVDDNSPDGTWKVAQTIAKSRSSVRVLRRKGKRGLSSAVVDGFDMAQGDMLAVMDADGQHDASLLLGLSASLKGGSDLVVGSRYMDGGSVGEWVRDRRIISSIGTRLALLFSRVTVSDPLSGFFAMKASVYKKIRPALKPTGFKILLEVLAHVPDGTKVAEIPLIFRLRLHGRSKLSLKVHFDFMCQICRLALSRLISRSCVLCHLFFFALVIVMTFFLAPKAWDLRLFLSHPEIRLKAAEGLRSVVDSQGWLLSDIDVQRVTTGSLLFSYREHRRSPAPPLQCELDLITSSFSCAE